MSKTVPYIDPNVKHVGVSKLRTLNATALRHFENALVIQDNDTPLAVLLTYDQFLAMQAQLQSVLETIEVVVNEDERTALLEGLRAVSEGRTRPLSDIRAELRKRVK